MKRSAPLKPGPGPVRRTPLKARTAARKPPRDTGPSRAVRRLVLERDSYQCVSCGRSIRDRPHSLQHRKARGRGGSSDPLINSTANLIVLCGSATSPDGCHLRCEQRRDREMNAQGYWLWSWQNPLTEPVMLFSQDGSGVTKYLTADGHYADEPPGGAPCS